MFGVKVDVCAQVTPHVERVSREGRVMFRDAEGPVGSPVLGSPVDLPVDSSVESPVNSPVNSLVDDSDQGQIYVSTFWKAESLQKLLLGSKADIYPQLLSSELANAHSNGRWGSAVKLNVYYTFEQIFTPPGRRSPVKFGKISISGCGEGFACGWIPGRD